LKEALVSRSFSKANLRRDVENSAEKFGLPATFQARFAKSVLEARDIGVSLQAIAPGESMPFAHRHKEQPEEIYVVVAGSGTLTIDQTEHPVEEWDVVHVAGHHARHFAAGPDGIEFIAFGRIGDESDAELIAV
jgi:uncharacterized cupin superfamily protein